MMSNKLIKIISANEQVFPQTVSEAVLFNDAEKVITLDKVLNKKVEQIITTQDSGLTNYKQGTSIILTHANKITPNTESEPLLIKHDSNGHILATDPFKKYTVTVNEQVYTQYNGSKDTTISLGDDFKIDDKNNISLTWGTV